MKKEKLPTVLLEMRPALDGYAGIPQETRLLFRGLRMLKSFEVEGMLQTSQRILAKGTVETGLLFNSRRLPEHRKINRYSRVVISAAENPFSTLVDRVLDLLERRMTAVTLTFGTLLNLKRIKLTSFRTTHFEDFIWRSLFAKTLPASDFTLVCEAKQRICSTPWHIMHKVGLNSLSVLRNPKYPKLDTQGVDIFIGQTPYPGRLTRNTAFVIRYHDALPVFMPHTISDKSLHQATHIYALMSNIRSGAYFACVSEATRCDLLKMFPDAERRAVTIHNMVSHHYHLDPRSTAAQVPGIIRSRLYGADPDAKDMGLSPKFLTLREQENFYRQKLGQPNMRYLLVVSTIEPRKNHARLIAAWEAIKAEVDPALKLVVVGTLGWGYLTQVKEFRSWIERGELFMLNAVPAPDLRVLYKHAIATVCPSLGEGFDFSGVEAMSSGGVVIASDIPVHREVYDHAARYFNPYATASLVGALKAVIYADDAEEVQGELRLLGQEVAARYQPDRILPQWDNFLARVLQESNLPRRELKALPAQLWQSVAPARACENEAIEPMAIEQPGYQPPAPVVERLRASGQRH